MKPQEVFKKGPPLRDDLNSDGEERMHHSDIMTWEETLAEIFTNRVSLHLQNWER